MRKAPKTAVFPETFSAHPTGFIIRFPTDQRENPHNGETNMRQAIQTKFLPATNSKPSRVKAIAEAGSVILSWDHAMNGTGNHRTAAMTLAKRKGWTGEWFGGAIPKTSGYCFVMNDGGPEFAF
jgi:hypothetical protein